MNVKDALAVGNKAVEGRGRAGAPAKGEKRDRQAGGEVSAPADRVELSGRSREMAKAHETLAATPSVRQEKIDAIKERIANNDYTVDAESVAHKMISDFLQEIT